MSMIYAKLAGSLRAVPCAALGLPSFGHPIKHPIKHPITHPITHPIKRRYTIEHGPEEITDVTTGYEGGLGGRRNP
ncbi:hypothetical protein HOY80DRAFT_985843 [Tuber brumale]|nr:hypothetical protein HOY80DRAFT_985843 [Tuber brumale]